MRRPFQPLEITAILSVFLRQKTMKAAGNKRTNTVILNLILLCGFSLVGCGRAGFEAPAGVGMGAGVVANDNSGGAGKSTRDAETIRGLSVSLDAQKKIAHIRTIIKTNLEGKTQIWTLVGQVSLADRKDGALQDAANVEAVDLCAGERVSAPPFVQIVSQCKSNCEEVQVHMQTFEGQVFKAQVKVDMSLQGDKLTVVDSSLGESLKTFESAADDFSKGTLQCNN